MTERLLLTSERSMLDHDPGHERRSTHPESPARLACVLERLESVADPPWRWEGPVAPVSREVLQFVHPLGHVERVLATRGRAVQIDPDTGTSPGSIDAALTAVGRTVDGVRRIFDTGPLRCAFALVRPPGHHAEPTRSMGFCLFNNLAIATEVALRELGVRRVLIVDWDVHHGNGTQAAFYGRSDVLVFDVHQSPHYPGTGAVTDVGAGAGEGYTINVPLAPGASDPDYLGLFRHVLAPVADAFQPELVVIAAGFDAHVADPLGDMCVTTPGFARLCRAVRSIADRHARGRCLLTLEGGYDLDALSESVLACASELARPDPVVASETAGELGPGSRAVVQRLAALHGRRWPISGV